jgi:hypothetical protein
MKLQFLSEMFEIIGEDLTQPKVVDRHYGGKFNFSRDLDKSDDEIGRGQFSKVMPHPADPHMVRKQTFKPIGPSHKNKADGFYDYVKILIDNHLMDNIHFPKVYEVDTNTDSTNTKRHQYTIERLEDLSKLSREEFEALVETHLLRPARNVEVLAEIIAAACTSEYDRRHYIRLDSLKDACTIIQHIDENNDFRADLHEGNMMFRRTPHGFQLVISDPFGLVKAKSLQKYS